MPVSVPPTAAGSKPQPTTGAKKKKRELVTGKSKKHGGAKWLYERRNGKLIPVRPVGKKGGKGDGDKSGKRPSPSKPKVDERPFGAYTDEINRGADEEFAPAERQLQEQEGIASQHSRDLQTVYD